MHRLRVGDWVEVRSKEEILQTLDSNSQLDGMPFMPEMFAFCGQRFQVYKRAHKTCDTVFPVRGRRVAQAVHLQTRCDGQGHAGCQAGCLLFWKEVWLKPLGRKRPDDDGSQPARRAQLITLTSAPRCTEPDVWAGTLASDSIGQPATYVCQATQLPYFTTPLAWWDLRQYVEDYTSGNVGFWALLRGFVYAMYYSVSNAGIGVGPAMRWLYDCFCPLWGGTKWPRKTGTIAAGQPTPAVRLNLQPGELIRVKSQEEILQTIDSDSKNRGMYWDAEMVPYCGETHRLLKRVTQIIDEKTGRMQVMKTPCIVLDSVVCKSRYSYCRMFCPRSIYSYWREIWLERVEPAPSSADQIKEVEIAR
jgi:hypothetical protein